LEVGGAALRALRLEAKSRRQMTDGGQRADDRGQRTDDRGQKTDDRGQRADDRGQRADDRGQRTEENFGLRIWKYIEFRRQRTK
jgi:hypothetical protein